MNIKIKLTRTENLMHFNVPKDTIITLDLEREYLPVVVASEVYESESRTPMEAKKAQAVAARTYAMCHTQGDTVIDDTSDYQAYRWKELLSIPNCAQAVLDTAGQVLMHRGQLITAWYSSSNGGRTKRSDEAWSTYKPWTVAQDDPWDVAARAKWGDVNASHGVGMSQMGAAYAAFIGESYIDILKFYYADTDIVAGYGESGMIGGKTEEGKSKMINPKDLVQYARDALGGGYCWGSSGEKCSLSYRQELAAREPAQSDKLLGVCAKWDGKRVWDCSGLFRGAWKELLAKKSGGATTIYNTWCTQKGAIDSMPDQPGIAVFRWDGKSMQHIGLYVGDGMVIEARGSKEGVIIGPLSGYPWTHWGMLADVDYAGVSPVRQLISEDALYLAEVINVKTGLNFRSSPVSTTNTIMLLPLGAVVEVLQDNAGNGMCKARYLGKVGYCTRSYLSELAPEEIPDEPTEEPEPTPVGSNTFELKPLRFVAYPAIGLVTVETPGGQVIANDGDYIVEELPGGPYVVKYEVFRQLAVWVAPDGSLKEI